MMRSKCFVKAGLACLVAMLAVDQAGARMVAPPPVILRVPAADLVLVGKVTGYGPKMVKSELYKGDDREMQIALVKVGDTLLGKAGKEIKVGFFPPRQGGGRPGRGLSVQLKQDEESLLFLTKHPTQKDVYMAANYYDAVARKDNPGFAKDLEQVKKAAKLLDKPSDGLKSKDADDRFLTAALLITRYRTPKGDTPKLVDIPAEESKLILQTLADADWNNRNPKLGYQATPQSLFFRLGVTEKEGWKRPKDFTKLAEEAKKWCKDNAGKYRIQRYVAEVKKEEK